MRKRHKGVNYAKYGYIFSIPFVLGFLVFTLYPLGYTAVLAFTDFSGAASLISGEMNILDDPFENFSMLLFDNQLFWTSITNTFRIWITNFIPQIVLALLLTAWFTNNRNKIKGQGLFKVLFYMPNIITAGSIAVLFGAFFAFPLGPANHIISLLGIENQPFNFTASPAASRNIIAFIQFWMWYGYTMLILIAGVLGINPELYEVAEIDGANGIQKFFFVTLPNLKTVLLFTVVTSIVGGITMFDIPWLFNQGGPVNSTTTVSLFIYNLAFTGRLRYNVAAAASILVFLMIAALSVAVFYLLRDKDAAQLKKEERALRRSLKAEMKGVQGNG